MGTAKFLKTRTNTTEALLSKVDGGRIRNNRPTETHNDGLLVDIDFGGFYAESMRNQIFPVGNPMVLRFDSESRKNQEVSLRQFLKQYQHEMVSGLWFARISTREFDIKSTPEKPIKFKLQYQQDFFASWFDFSKIEIDGLNYASDLYAVQEILNELDIKSGQMKVFNRQIINGLINHDGVQWLDRICGAKQRSELLDNLFVRAAILYPASERCHELDDFPSRLGTQNGENTCILSIEKDSTSRTEISKEGYAWFGIKLDEFLINNLQKKRMEHPKKTPMNELYKLCINSLYGMTSSRHFNISNVVVGNNVTARGRACVWYAEKGLYFYQSITDGGIFDPNRVVFQKPGRRVVASDLVNIHQKKRPNLRFGVLKEDYDRIGYEWVPDLDSDEEDKMKCLLHLHKDGEFEVVKKSKEWVNRVAWEHLQMLFPGVDILHQKNTCFVVDKKIMEVSEKRRIGQFQFDMKDFYDFGRFHGSGNYLISNPNNPENKPEISMRAYTSKNGQCKEIIESWDSIDIGRRYEGTSIPRVFLSSLDSPTSVKRGSVFVRETILKINAFRNRSEFFLNASLLPGDTVFSFGLLREFSLSQFTFQTLEQYRKVDKQIGRLRGEYGQSMEMFFLNPDETLNYKKMIESVDRWIGAGFDDLRKQVDTQRKKAKRHPYLDRKDTITEEYSAVMEGQGEEEEDDIQHSEELLDGSNVDYEDDFDADHWPEVE